MRSTLLAAAACLATSTAAQAVPLLQLDIVGGHYDSTTSTIVAGSNPFTLVAIFTPTANMTSAQIANTLAQNAYISAAVSPGYGPAGGGLGSFSFNSQTVDVTSDMTYGVPPIDAYNQDFDPGDLSKHGVFPTYFSEFAFNFNPAMRTTTYNTAENPGGLSPDPSGGSYYATFAVDTRLLDPRYVIHFDLYTEQYARCGRTGTCTDLDVDQFAPFSHDAESAPVPEPATLLLLGSGVVVGAVRKRRQRQAATLAA